MPIFKDGKDFSEMSNIDSSRVNFNPDGTRLGATNIQQAVSDIATAERGVVDISTISNTATGSLGWYRMNGVTILTLLSVSITIPENGDRIILIRPNEISPAISKTACTIYASTNTLSTYETDTEVGITDELGAYTPLSIEIDTEGGIYIDNRSGYKLSGTVDLVGSITYITDVPNK